MVCRYFKDNKELNVNELQSFMRSLQHEQKLKIAPEIAKDSYQALSWTPGEAQAARYDLSKQIESIDYQKQKDGTYSLGIFGKRGEALEGLEKDYKPEELPNVVGKEIAQKIIGNGNEKVREGTLEGLDLKVGGEGMKAFYDKMLVDKANAIAKKYGGKVEDKNIRINKINNLAEKLKENGYNPDEVNIQQILADHGGRRPNWISDDELDQIEKC
jgi:hypothetical protein